MLSRCITLFLVFCKISAITMGGGLVMIPVMEKEFLEKRNMLTKEDMLDTVAFVQSMPGVIAVNMALMIGYRAAKLPGALVSAFGVVIPPFLTILLIAFCFQTLSGNEAMSHIFSGVRAATCALILLSVIKMGKSVFKNHFAMLIALLAFLIFVLIPHINAIYVLMAAGVAGLVLPQSITMVQKKKEGEKKS